ncbi:MAG: class I SAM-dependent methyltransferase [Acidobacteriota bacterium]
MHRLALVTVLALSLLQGQPPDLTSDAALWKDFASWVEALKPLPPGHKSTLAQTYGLTLRARGISEADGTKLLERVNRLRRASPAREAVYWNAAFKLGGGPDDPLRLLQEVVRNRKPGRSLDPAMGRGRNTIYLASLGWDSTGYDMAKDALTVAQDYAAKAGVKITAIEARHETFPFGENQWDLIVCSYCYMDADDPKLPPKFARALRPGGLVVFQAAWDRNATLAQLMANWKGFKIVRYEDLDAGAETSEWRPSLTYPTLKIVLEKPAPPAKQQK